MTKWLILIGVVLVICIAEWIREISTFKITHYHVTSEKLKDLTKEMKVIFLSDLHNNCYGKGNSRLVEAIRKQGPDLILVGGDMLTGIKNSSEEVAKELMKQLVDIAPVYYANGNHEQRMKLYPETFGNRYDEYKQFLQSIGVVLLENASANIKIENCPIRLLGLEIPRRNYKKFQKTELTLETMQDCIGASDAEKYQILLAHNPVYTDTYVNWGADLILSGHFHGGLVRLPGIGGVITPQFRLFPKYSGEMTTIGDQTVVVSKGLGTHTIKVRFFNPAELIVLHLKK